MFAKTVRNIALALPLLSLIAPVGAASALAAAADTAAPAAKTAAPAKAGHKAGGHKKAAETTAAKHVAIAVENPWARAMLPGAKMGVGYFEIKNNTDRPVRLAAVRSNVADQVEIHSSAMDGNVMKMRMMKNGVEIPPHSGLSFKPGSYHLMFINPKTPFKAGEVIKTHFSFDNGHDIAVPFNVREAGAMTSH